MDILNGFVDGFADRNHLIHSAVSFEARDSNETSNLLSSYLNIMLAAETLLISCILGSFGIVHGS